MRSTVQGPENGERTTTPYTGRALRWRVLIACSGACLIPLVACFLLLWDSHVAEKNSSRGVALERVARLIVTDIEHELRQGLLSVEYLASTLPPSDQGVEKALQPWLEQALAFHPHWLQVGIGTVDGDLVVVSVDSQVGFSAEGSHGARQPWLRQVLTTGQPFISSSVDREETPSVTLSVPVPSGASRSAASHSASVLYARLDIEAALGLSISEKSLSEKNVSPLTVWLFDSEERLILSHSSFEESPSHQTSAELVTRAQQEGFWTLGGAESASILIHGADGVSRRHWMASHSFDALGWRVLVTRGAEESRWTAGELMGLAILVLLLAAGLAWYGALSLEKELRFGMASLMRGSEVLGGPKTDTSIVASGSRVWRELEELELCMQAMTADWRDRLCEAQRQAESREGQLQEVRRACESLEAERQKLATTLASRSRDGDREVASWSVWTTKFQHFESLMQTIFDHTKQLLATPPVTVQSEDSRTFHLARIDAVAKDLLRRFESAADFGRAEAGLLRLEAASFDPMDEAARQVEAAKSRARSRGLTLEWERTEGAVHRMQSDVRRFRQILDQILSNAFQFTRHGRVKVSCEWRSTEEMDSGEGLEMPTTNSPWVFICRVEDTGVGIAYEAQQRLFSPRVGTRGTAVHEGAGLGFGLPLCHHLVRVMGGILRVESSPGVGSTFSFILPRDLGMRAAEKLDSKISGADTSATRGHILIADDHAINRDVMESQVINLGYRTRVVADGIEVLQALEEESFDLLLLDCQMPRLDGYETVRRLRSSQSESRSMPVIAVTAHVEDERQHCLAAGMDDYMLKPVRQETLTAMLLRWLPGSAEICRSQDTPDDAGSSCRDPLWGEDPGLDWETLDQIQRLGESSGKDLLSKILRTLLRSLPERLETCRRLLQSGDREALGEQAHGLKGSAGNGGAITLAETFGSLEKACKTNLDLQNAFEDVETELARVTPTLESLLEARRATDVSDDD